MTGEDDDAVASLVRPVASGELTDHPRPRVRRGAYMAEDGLRIEETACGKTKSVRSIGAFAASPRSLGREGCCQPDSAREEKGSCD